MVQAEATDGVTRSNQASVRLLYEPAQKLTFDKKPEVTEGQDDTLELAVTLSEQSGQTVLVDFATRDAVAEDQVSATPGSDYEAVSGTLRFAPGETGKTISVPILTDDLDEPRERFRVEFSNPRHAQLPARWALVTIVDDSSRVDKPVASIEPTRPGRVYESEDVYQFDVVLSRPSGHAITLEIEFLPDEGTATLGADYQDLGGGQQVVRFRAGADPRDRFGAVDRRPSGRGGRDLRHRFGDFRKQGPHSRHQRPGRGHDRGRRPARGDRASGGAHGGRGRQRHLHGGPDLAADGECGG